MKKSFLLYTDQIEIFKALSDDQKGALIMHVFEYNMNGNTPPKIEDPVLSMAFTALKMSMDRDIGKYNSIVERNRINGLLGGRPPKKPKKPTGLINNPNNPSKPRKADSDSDSDSDSEKQKKGNPYPDWLDVPLWKEFRKHRTKMKAPLTDHGEKLLIQELHKLMDKGHPQADLINESIGKGWKGIFPIKDGKKVVKRTYEDGRVEYVPKDTKPNTAWKDKLNGWAAGGTGDK